MLSVRFSPEERQLIEKAAKQKSWKTANFLRVSALDRAAQVLNLSSPTSFDFSGAARRYAEALVAPRDVAVFYPDLWHEVPMGRCGDGPIDLPEKEMKLEDAALGDFRPAPLTADDVDQLQKAMRLGGAEFAVELLAECRRLVSNSGNAGLPPPIDPQNLGDLDLDEENA